MLRLFPLSIDRFQAHSRWTYLIRPKAGKGLRDVTRRRVTWCAVGVWYVVHQGVYSAVVIRSTIVIMGRGSPVLYCYCLRTTITVTSITISIVTILCEPMFRL